MDTAVELVVLTKHALKVLPKLILYVVLVVLTVKGNKTAKKILKVLLVLDAILIAVGIICFVILCNECMSCPG